MKLILKEKIISWFDSFNIYYESGDICYKVRGKLAWGHKFVIYDAVGNEVGKVRERIIDLMPHFDLYKGGEKVGTISKKITVLKPKFKVDFNGWDVKGDVMSWNYSVHDKTGRETARVYKKLLRLLETYVIEVPNEDDVLDAVMVVLAIAAEKCSAQHKEEKKEEKALKAKAKAARMKE